MKQTVKAQCSKDAERKHKELMCKVRIGAELAEAVLAYVKGWETKVSPQLEEIVALAREFQKQGGK